MDTELHGLDRDMHASSTPSVPPHPCFIRVHLWRRSLLESKVIGQPTGRTRRGGYYSALSADYRIDAAGAAGGDPAGEEGDREEHDRDPGEGDRVGGAHAVEEALQEAGAGEGERQADERADRRQPHALVDDELLDIGELRAEGHAQADLAGAPGGTQH